MDSEELEWELYDIFASGIFAFPIYEHNSARRIVRYLLMRGVPVEDVATAIEDHAVDLRAWLERRPGHHMVGEWVMAWLNESRDQYKADRRVERLYRRNRRQRPRSASPEFSTRPDEPYYGRPYRGDVRSYDTISSTTASSNSSSSDTYRRSPSCISLPRSSGYNNAALQPCGLRELPSGVGDDSDSDSVSGALVGASCLPEAHRHRDVSILEVFTYDAWRRSGRPRLSRSCPDMQAVAGHSASWTPTSSRRRPGRLSVDLGDTAFRHHTNRPPPSPTFDIKPEIIVSAALQRRQTNCSEEHAIEHEGTDPPDSGNVSDMQCACAAISCCGHESYCPVTLPSFPRSSPPPDRPPTPPSEYPPLPVCDNCRCTLPHYVVGSGLSYQQRSTTWSGSPCWNQQETNNERWYSTFPVSQHYGPTAGRSGGELSSERADGRWNDVCVCDGTRITSPHTA